MGNGRSSGVVKGEVAAPDEFGLPDVDVEENAVEIDCRARTALERRDMGDFKEVFEMIRAQSVVKTVVEARRGYLHIAAANDHLDACRFLVEKGQYSANEADEKLRTPVHIAAREGSIEAITYFISEASADVNLVDIDGFTPFMFAVLSGHLPIGKLLSAEMDVETIALHTLRDGRTCIHLCAQEGHIVFLKWICTTFPSVQIDRIEKEEGRTAFHLAAMTGHATILDYLLHQCRADPFACDSNGRTALHHGAMNDHIDTCRYLIEQACLDPLARDNSGKSCSDYAEEHPDRKVAAYLDERESNYSYSI